MNLVMPKVERMGEIKGDFKVSMIGFRENFVNKRNRENRKRD